MSAFDTLRLESDNARLRALVAELVGVVETLLASPSDDWWDAVDTEDGYTLTPKGIAERKAQAALDKARA